MDEGRSFATLKDDSREQAVTYRPRAFDKFDEQLTNLKQVVDEGRSFTSLEDVSREQVTRFRQAR
jgi:hypothetical protein